MAAMMGLSSTAYRNHKSRSRSLPVDSVFSLADHIPISFERIMGGGVDLETLHEHAKGNVGHIPARYRIGAFSKRRTSVNALYFIENHLGAASKDEILKHLQVNPAVFKNPDETISIHFVTDVLNYLARYQHRRESFVQIGRYSTDTNRHSRLAQVYAECRTPSEMYDKLFNALVSNYDENYDYRLTRLSKIGATLRVYQRKRTEDALNLRVYGSVPICWMRIGINAALPKYKQLPEANVTKTKCIFEGDDCCEMEIDFEFSHYSALRRPVPVHRCQ